MEELGSKKRVRDDSDDALELEESSPKKRVVLELDESELDSPEVRRLRDDLLDNLDDSDLCTASQDLDSFMKSFEQEISASPPADAKDPTSDSGQSRPDLGFLWEASDDELGLPPSTTPPNEAEKQEEAELVRVASESAELSELWKFDDQTSGFENFDFGIGDAVNFDNASGEYVALDGLFDYSDLAYGSSDFSWRHETLPAQ